MAQHFLLSAASRTLSLRSIYKAGEDAAYQTFCEMRWPETDGEAVCPCCGFDEAYKITTRRKFKCKACHHQFSVTSGTIFACLMTFLGSWGKREPLPATPFMAGSGGGWIANSLVYQDR